jgi:hypothetical protein
LFENPEPVPAQDFFNIAIFEAALDQFSGQVPRVRVIYQIQDEVRSR